MPREVVEQLVVRNRQELLPNEDNHYFAFADVSGGRGDASALAIAHKSGKKVVLDFCQQYKSPHNPHQVIASICEELRRFSIRKITGDAYGAEFSASSFAANGVTYLKCDRNKSALYLELLPLMMSHQVEFLDNPTLVHQLTNLERRTRSGGRDVIDHQRASHDDLSNAVAGVVVVTAKPRVLIGAGGF